MQETQVRSYITVTSRPLASHQPSGQLRHLNLEEAGPQRQLQGKPNVQALFQWLCVSASLLFHQDKQTTQPSPTHCQKGLPRLVDPVDFYLLDLDNTQKEGIWQQQEGPLLEKSTQATYDIYIVLNKEAKMQETQVQSLSWKDPLEKGMATHFSTLIWRIPQTEQSGRLQSMGSQRARHD